VVADTVAASVKGRIAAWPFRAVLVEGEAAKKDAMKAATVALATSGTVSTELALAGAPMVIAYRLGGLSYALTRPLMTAKHITLFNIAADDRIAPEYLQDEATPDALADAVALRLDDPVLRADQIVRQYAALDRMGRDRPDPSAAAADVVLSVAG
jgi:lipid-A-disaccharide synthase